MPPMSTFQIKVIKGNNAKRDQTEISVLGGVMHVLKVTFGTAQSEHFKIGKIKKPRENHGSDHF